jgi:hypothetical protein
LESAKDQQDYKFAPLGDQGVAVFYQSAILSLDTAQWVFIHYDTNLVRTNLFKLKIPNLCQYFAADLYNNKLFLYLQKPAYKKDSLKNYLLEWNLMTNDFQLYNLINYKLPHFSSIKVADDNLFIVINETNAKSIVFYNYKTHSKQVTQFTNEEITSLESFCIDTLKKTTCFCMFLKNKQGSWAELFITDYSGNIQQHSTLPFSSDLIFNSAKIAIVGLDSILLCGGYSSVKDKKTKGSYSGIYSLLYHKNKFSDISTYSFGALLEKDSGLNIKLLEEQNLTMNAHITQNNGHIFVITDVFYPEYQYYSSPSFRYYGYYGYDSPTQSFEGFRFLYSSILELNKKGVFLNEWFFPIQNVLTKSFYNLVNLYQDEEENTLFFYVSKNEIISQLMNGKNILGPQSTIPIELTYKTDILEYSSNIYMQHWYNNSFLVSGYQYIKNSQRGSGKGKRYVFFLNKLICE